MNSGTVSVDLYIAGFPKDVQKKLKKIRSVIRKVVPKAEEDISYGMPVYKLNGKRLVYFGGFSNHIGFYALPSTHIAFADALSAYKHGKGSVQFPHDQPLPIDLIEQMVTFRVIESGS
jgi:uncharacterized protein YdhG (YjbR/CyaY superfamily)